MTGKANGQEYEPSVTFQDQTSSGGKVTVSEIVTKEPVNWKVHADDTDYARGHFGGQQRLENKTIELESEIKVSKKVYFSIFPEGGGYSLAHDGAMITVQNDSILGVNEIKKNPDAGFNYPYFLYVPHISGEWDEHTPLLVEPNNSPSNSDDLSYHKEFARGLVENQMPRHIADELSVPLLVPTFPRPRSEPVDWRHYTHLLDDQTLKISDGPLERIDKQLLKMVEDAQERLASESHPVREEIIMDGFSSSGHFVDRFTTLHPERVLSITAGGVNGMVVLPRKKAKGHKLDYHVGIANVEELTGSQVNLEALDAVNQFYYVGDEDPKDTIGHRGPWTDEELEQIALDVYGEDPIEDRFPYCEKVYENEGIEATFKIYEGVGHTSAPAFDDIIEFHKEVVPQNNSRTTGSSTDTRKTTSETTPNSSSNKETTPSYSPGFGIGTALGAIGGTGVLLAVYNRLFSE